MLQQARRGAAAQCDPGAEPVAPRNRPCPLGSFGCVDQHRKAHDLASHRDFLGDETGILQDSVREPKLGSDARVVVETQGAALPRKIGQLAAFDGTLDTRLHERVETHDRHFDQLEYGCSTRRWL